MNPCTSIRSCQLQDDAAMPSEVRKESEVNPSRSTEAQILESVKRAVVPISFGKWVPLSGAMGDTCKLDVGNGPGILSQILNGAWGCHWCNYCWLSVG